MAGLRDLCFCALGKAKGLIFQSMMRERVMIR